MAKHTGLEKIGFAESDLPDFAQWPAQSFPLKAAEMLGF